MELLRGSGEELRGELLRQGLEIDPTHRARLSQYLLWRTPRRRVTCTAATGWAGDTFVLADCAIGPQAGEVISQADASAAEYATGGVLRGWVEGAGALALHGVVDGRTDDRRIDGRRRQARQGRARGAAVGRVRRSQAWRMGHPARIPRRARTVGRDQARRRAALRGHAGRVFLERLTQDDTDLTAALADIKALPVFDAPVDDGQRTRAAGRFALIALAGELATQYGLTGWPEGAAIDAAAEAYRLWCSTRTAGRAEAAQVVEAVTAFIDRHGDARFSAIDADEGIARLVRDRAGWWRSRGGRREWLFTADGLREALRGSEVKPALETLVALKMLPAQGADGKHARPVRIDGRVVKVHHITVNEEANDGAA